MAIDGRYFVINKGEKFTTTFRWFYNSATDDEKIVFDDINDEPTSTGWLKRSPASYTFSISELYQGGTGSFGAITTATNDIIFSGNSASFDSGMYYGLVSATLIADANNVTDLLQFTVRITDDLYVDQIPFNETLALYLLALPTDFAPETVAFVKERVNNAALRYLAPSVVTYSRGYGWGSRITTACEDLMRWMLAEIIYPWDEDRNVAGIKRAIDTIRAISVDTNADGIPDTGATFGNIDLIRTG